LYRQLNHSKDADKNFNFWKVYLPSKYRDMTREEFYVMAEQVKSNEDRVVIDDFEKLNAVNEFIRILQNYYSSTRGGKSRKILRKKRIRIKHKRNTFLRINSKYSKNI